MLPSRCVAAGLLLLLVVETVAADVLVYRDGRRVRGLVANREQFVASGGRSAVLSFLPDSSSSGSGALIRVARDSVDHVILEDGDESRVFDMTRPGPPGNAPPIAPRPGAITAWRQAPGDDNSIAEGVVLTVVGLGAIGIGFGVKFGEAKVTVTGSSVDYQEKSYNGVNYALIGAGVVLTTAGIVMLDRTKPALTTRSTPGGSPGLAVAVRF